MAQTSWMQFQWQDSSRIKKINYIDIIHLLIATNKRSFMFSLLHNTSLRFQRPDILWDQRGRRTLTATAVFLLRKTEAGHIKKSHLSLFSCCMSFLFNVGLLSGLSSPPLQEEDWSNSYGYADEPKDDEDNSDLCSKQQQCQWKPTLVLHLLKGNLTHTPSFDVCYQGGQFERATHILCHLFLSSIPLSVSLGGDTDGLVSGLRPQITSVNAFPGTAIWWSGCVHLWVEKYGV